MLVEGYRPLKMAFDSGYALDELYYCPRLYENEDSSALVHAWQQRGVAAIECNEPVFRKIAYGDSPSGMLGAGPFVARPAVELRLTDKPLFLLAEGIEKPGNLGTMLRTADAAGADAVIVCDHRTDIHNPNVVRASQGALFTMPVFEGESEEIAVFLRSVAVRIVAAIPGAGKVYTDVDMQGPTALLVGSEDRGLSPFWMREADERVHIPMHGICDSLNVSTCAALLLYEAQRQRRKRIEDPQDHH